MHTVYLINAGMASHYEHQSSDLMRLLGLLKRMRPFLNVPA